MRLKYTRLRYDLDKIWEQSLAVYHRTGEEVAQDRYLVKELGKISSLHIVDGRVGQRDTRYVCANYALGVRHGQRWARPGDFLPALFYKDPWDFLQKQGYAPTEKPSMGDLVAYGSREQELLHYGICEDPRKLTVTSKWGSGPIIRHPLAHTYASYGSVVTFFAR